MEDDIEKIKRELHDLSKRYSTLTQVEYSSNASTLAKLLELMVKEGMTESSDPKNITRVIVKEADKGHFRGTFNDLECNFLLFPRRAEAEKALEQFKNLPDCFVRPIRVVEHEEKVYLAVEPFEAVEYKQKPSDERNVLLKNVLRIAIKLDLHNQLNDGFEHLVIANGQPKLCTPSNRCVKVKNQATQLKNIISNIVRTGCEDERHRRHFFMELEKSYTMTKLLDCLHHPLLLTSTERVFYHAICMLVIHSTSAHIDHKTKLSQQYTWIKMVENSGFEGLKATLSHRIYNDTIFEWYQFVRNCYHHLNEKLVKDQNGNTNYPYKDLYGLANDLDKLFPNLHESMHSYMCSQHLYDEYEGRKTRDSVQIAIHWKMEKLTPDLSNIHFPDFLELIDMYDFVLAKVCVQCRDPGIMESVRTKLMNDKKTVCGFVGKTISDVRKKVETKKDAKAALNRLLRHILFFTNCLCELERPTTTSFQYLVFKVISESCHHSTITHHANLAKSCGLPDMKVIEDILRYKLVNDTEKRALIKRANDLSKLICEWYPT